MAASTALPPRCSAAMPACAASGCPAHTIPLRPITTGRLDSKLTPCGVCGIRSASLWLLDYARSLLTVQVGEQVGAAVDAVNQLSSCRRGKPFFVCNGREGRCPASLPLKKQQRIPPIDSTVSAKSSWRVPTLPGSELMAFGTSGFLPPLSSAAQMKSPFKQPENQSVTKPSRDVYVL